MTASETTGAGTPVKLLDVAVGVVIRPDGSLLLGQRLTASPMRAGGSCLAANSSPAKPRLKPWPAN